MWASHTDIRKSIAISSPGAHKYGNPWWALFITFSEQFYAIQLFLEVFTMKRDALLVVLGSVAVCNAASNAFPATSEFPPCSVSPVQARRSDVGL